MLMLLAQAGVASALGYWVILAIIVAAIVGVLLVVIRTTGVSVPPWVGQILWIVLVAVVAVVAIRFLLRVGGIA